MVPMRRKILAFDGGPSPVVSIRVLKKIEEQFPGFLDRVDLFAGTSHGGIISLKLATLLSKGVPATRAIDECIAFDNEFLSLFKLTPVRFLRTLSGILPMNSSKEMVRFLEKHFTGEDGELLRMRDLRKPVTVSAFDLNAGVLRMANTFHPASRDITLLSAALACSSFPVLVPFFMPHQDALPIVDGGFGANSGAMPALSDALQYMHSMHAFNRDAYIGDFLPYITLLSMGALSNDPPLKIPLFEPLVQLTEKLGLFGRETQVKGGGVLRSAGWWFVLRNNVKVLLTLLENTQSLDRSYASNLLDRKRYYRMAPKLELLDFLWLLLTDLDTALRKADELTENSWAEQMKEYGSRKATVGSQPPEESQGDNELACWIDRHWTDERVELRSTSLDSLKRLATFDASAQPELPQRELAELGTCQFVKDAQNVFIVGPSGAGKSHLAQALGNEAVSRGYKVLCLPVARMLEQLDAARAVGTYDQKLADLTGVDLLILEDLGLKPMKDSGPGDFYDVVSECAGKKALIVTSCLPPAEWAERFGDQVLADAILTRLRAGSHEFVLTGGRPSKEVKPRQAASQGRH